MTDKKYELVIIGSGCAGLSAATYAGRGGHETLVIKGEEPGGQLTLTTDVANYPGFPEGISGPDLINRMEEQARKFGVDFLNQSVTDINDKNRPFKINFSNRGAIESESIIVASGSSARTLGIPGEDELMGFGVSTCATCDGAFFKGQDMAVVGGGDAACEEASFLTRFANKVYIIHRRDELRAEKYWVDEIKKHVENGDIEILWNTEVTDIDGSKDNGVDIVRTIHNPQGHPKEKLEKKSTTKSELDVGALFLAIGHIPNTEFLENTDVKINERGYLKIKSGVGKNSTKTNVDGIFGAGDVFDWHYQQAATAVGSGVRAALDADEYLS